MKKKTLMVDMDDVITSSQFFNLIQEFLSKKIDINTIKTYFLQDLITEDRRSEFWQYLEDKNFYDNSPLLDDCYWVLEQLNEKYELYIVTSYLWIENQFDISGSNLRNKYTYLREKLPFIKPEQYIFTTNKKILNFDIRIDDRLDNLSGAKIKILFDAWHNRDYTALELTSQKVFRVFNWLDIYEILK